MNHMGIFKEVNGKYFVFVKQFDMFICNYGRITINPGALCTIEGYDNKIRFINSNTYLYGASVYAEIASHFSDYMKEISKEEVNNVLLYRQFKNKVIDDDISKYLLDKVGEYNEYTDKFCHTASHKYDISDNIVNELNDTSPKEFIKVFTKEKK